LLRKSIPLLLAVAVGFVAGALAQDAGVLHRIVEAPPALLKKVTAPEPPPSSPADLRDTVKDLLKAKDVQGLIKSVAADSKLDLSKIDLKAVSEYAARYVVESPEFKRALQDQIKAQDSRRLVSDAARSPEFRQAVKDVVSSAEFKKLYRDMILDVTKSQKPK
jgi:hypothetical protein